VTKKEAEFILYEKEDAIREEVDQAYELLCELENWQDQVSKEIRGEKG